MIFVATFSFGKSLLRQLMSSGQSSTGTTNSSFNFRLVKQYMQECNENNLDLNSYVKMYGEFNKYVYCSLKFLRIAFPPFQCLCNVFISECSENLDEYFRW